MGITNDINLELKLGCCNAENRKYDVDFSDVRGQENVYWALEVAAVGGNNIIILIGL
ncbi:MAG TPA: ATP-binding protein [Bacteroidales bacterium]|nr:ATP-binding protein [Bacteroidales bacterium]